MERERACRAVYYLLQYRKHTFVFAASQCYIAIPRFSQDSTRVFRDTRSK